jgi:hypothetical protein
VGAVDAAGCDVVVAAVYVASGFGGLRWANHDGVYLGIGGGTIGAGHWPEFNTPPGWHGWLGVETSWWFGRVSDDYGTLIYAPLWAVLVPLATAAGWLFWRASPPSVGQCGTCRYSRSGLSLAAHCPECGAKPPKAADESL